MRVFALSDIHVDYDANAKWVSSLSQSDFRDDLLVLAGDISDTLSKLDWCLRALSTRFKRVLFVPGNHELWVTRDGRGKSSLQKLEEVTAVVESSGASMNPFYDRQVSIIPLLGWYDYSFGAPSIELQSIWMDYYACRWPSAFNARDITAHFAALNEEHFKISTNALITFSHFLPRIDLMPAYIPKSKQLLYPVLGSTTLEHQLRRFEPDIHVYGHSHVNRNITIDGVRYVNNAIGYPHERWIGSRRLLCIHEC